MPMSGNSRRIRFGIALPLVPVAADARLYRWRRLPFALVCPLSVECVRDGGGEHDSDNKAARFMGSDFVVQANYSVPRSEN